jgi:hypothetical protein
MDLAEVAAELYGLDPAEFVPARTAHVKDARTAGNRELAKEIAALRKPTQVAWVVNISARELPDELEALLAVGDALRDAQRTLSGDDLRRLNAQRQQVVRVFARRAGEAAAVRGHPVGENALREVGQTLHAALADPVVAQQVRTGTLITAASYSGFGLTGLAAVTDQPGEPAKVKAPQPVQRPGAAKAGDSEAKKAAAERLAAERARRIAEATETADTARGQLAAARTAMDAARAKLAATDTEIARLRDELDHAEQTRQFVRNTERAAAEQLRKAEKEFDRAQRTLEHLTGQE